MMATHTHHLRRYLLLLLAMMTLPSIADQGSDATAILQALLNSQKLAQYYHFDTRPQRKPLRIKLNTDLKIDANELHACKQAVVIVQDKDPNTLEISSFQLDGSSAQANFAFPVEGIRGSASFTKRQDGWALEHINIAEH